MCLRQYLRCSLALAVLRQVQRSAGRAGGSGSRHHHQGSTYPHTGRSGGGGANSGGGGASGGASAGNGAEGSSLEVTGTTADATTQAAAASAPAASSSLPGTSSSPRPPSRAPLHGRPAWWGSKPLAVDDTSHATNVALVKGDGPASGGEGRRQAAALAGDYGGWIAGIGTGVGGEPEAGVGRGGGVSWGGRGKMGKEGLVVRLGMHWGPAVQLIHHRGIQVGFG